MKRIIMLLSLSLALLVSSQDVQAAKPHKKHKAHIASTQHPNIVKPTPRPDDEASLIQIDSSCDAQCMISDASALVRESSTAYLCPSLELGACNLSPLFLSLINTSQMPEGTPSGTTGTTLDEPTLATTTVITDNSSITNYYYAKAVYEPPTMVTINGYSVPVRGNPLYFSPFKHRHGAAMPVHNKKGDPIYSSSASSQ